MKICTLIFIDLINLSRKAVKYPLFFETQCSNCILREVQLRHWTTHFATPPCCGYPWRKQRV